MGGGGEPAYGIEEIVEGVWGDDNGDEANGNGGMDVGALSDGFSALEEGLKWPGCCCCLNCSFSCLNVTIAARVSFMAFF